MPISLPWMESVDAKMIRAHETLSSIEREINEYFSTVDVKHFLKADPGIPYPWIIVVPTDSIPPPRISVLVGEWVHNMRSALDNLVCGLARTKDRFADCGGTAFPFTENEADWDGKAHQKLLVGVPREAKKIIKSVQPWRTNLKPNPLVITNRLSNTDKHQQYNFTLSYSHNARIRVHCNDGTVVEIAVNRPIHSGQIEEYRLPVPPAVVQPSARIESARTFILTFQDESDWSDIPVVQILQQCFDYVEQQVIGPLTPFFRPAAPAGIGDRR